MIRILYICNEYPPYTYGGIGVFVKSLAEALPKSNFEVHVIGQHSSGNNIAEMTNGVRVTMLKSPTINVFRKLKIHSIVNGIYQRFTLSKYVSSYCKKNRIEIVESVDWSGPLFYKPPCPLIVRLHGSNYAHAVYEKKKGSAWLRYWENRNIRMADYILSVSRHMLQSTIAAFGDLYVEKEIIPNFYNADIFHLNNQIERNNRFKLLFVGKCNERKGIFELLKIFELLHNTNNQYELHIVGDCEQLKKNIGNYLSVSASSNVYFYGRKSLEELCDLYNQFSLLMMPTRAEAFGLTVIEAMACGCVVVMNDIPVAHELIRNNETGVIVDFYNTAQTVDILSKINDQEMNNIAIQAQQYVVESFGNKIIVQQNIDFYLYIKHKQKS